MKLELTYCFNRTSTPLHLTFGDGTHSCTNMLLEVGADPTLSTPDLVALLHLMSYDTSTSVSLVTKGAMD